jgi:hypothetical protein
VAETLKQGLMQFPLHQQERCQPQNQTGSMAISDRQVGCSYVHGLSDGQALEHIESLYQHDILCDMGEGWEKIFLK